MPEICVIEINDAGLVAATGEGVPRISPGYAVVEGAHLHVGEEGFARARLNPRRSYDRFWSRLDQQPLQRPAGDAHSHADLAYFHLQHLWQALGEGADEVIFAVPADFDKNRLALLLGIAQTLEIPVTGLVSAPVAAAAAVDTDAARLYLDVELHRVTATEVAGDSDLRVHNSNEVIKQGLSGLYDAWAGLIAERFVQETRYDPLHQAAAEQTLYRNLPDWLAKLREQGSARLELEVGQRSHHIDLSVADLMRKTEDFYRPVVERAAAGRGSTIVLSHRLAALPGLEAMLEQRLGVAPTSLMPDSIADSVLAHIDVIRTDAQAPAFVTRLPGAISGAVAVSAAPEKSAGTQTPTHLLYQWRAYPINGAPLVLEPAPRGLRLGESPGGAMISMRGTEAVLEPGRNDDNASPRVNGAEVTSDQPLGVGDKLVIADVEMRLIALVSDSGANP